jgi:c-di-GMP-binding flagellar brake protein YcgR
MARRVRSRRRDDNSYEVAYHFIDISGKHRDAIIGCCFTLQRKQLQLKVRVRGG